MLISLIRQVYYKNRYLFLGIILGIVLSHFNVFTICLQEQNGLPNLHQNEHNILPFDKIEIRSSVIPNYNATKRSDKVIRPRYYSTELGIRDKIFVAIFTSEEKVNEQAIYINKTTTHIVDKVKFFITVRNKMKTTFNLSGIVGFTDTRPKYRPFHVIKCDTFIQDYDYYYLMNDYNYLNVRRLKDIVSKISVSLDVYLGTTTEESSFCNLDAGILLSNSVLRSMKENLDWCISNSISDDCSENLGRCVHYSTNLECQNEIQSQKITTFKLKHFDLEKRWKTLTNKENFHQAVTVYPILRAKDYYLLNSYFLRLRLEELHLETNRLKLHLNQNWPPGQRIGAIPATRFDLPSQLYFNTTHMFFPDDFTNIKNHNEVDLIEIKKVLRVVKTQFLSNNHNLTYRRLINGYRSFDLSRGLDYILDLGFRDLSTGKVVVKRFEVCKPLGQVEFIPVPYVTENPRITILLPIEEAHNDLALASVENYRKAIMEHKSKSVLMLVLLYQYNSSSKGTNDKFAKLKQMAMKLSYHFQSDENKIVWVSIRLPLSDTTIRIDAHKAINFAVIDLALKKIGLESLVLVLDVYSDVSLEFLNRVRMNTILGHQIYCPIPFRQYHPNVTQLNSLEIHKNSGHFDRDFYKYLSFYGKDYVFVRKQQNEVPLIRTDNDIAQIINHPSSGNVFELFVTFSLLHKMRATEKDLKIKHHKYDDDQQIDLFLGTKVQLGKIMLNLESNDGATL